MKKIYVASSWRNDYQQEVVKVLRCAGYDVYDFKNPHGDTGFHWSEIDPDWQDWTPSSFIAGLNHPIAESGFNSDMTALSQCDICVLVLPCGRSAHLEAGWAAGAGKSVYILIPEKCEPELMYKMTTGVFENIGDIITALKDKYREPKEVYTDDDLRYAAYARCECGAGLAYPKGMSFQDVSSWDCSDILTGRAKPGTKHSAKYPFAFYEIKSEDQPSANGATTRRAIETKEEPI